jgi:crotonobetainyl-CoA:carnitine CoA-transferase CaiB-like acyl-CoA transferase
VTLKPLRPLMSDPTTTALPLAGLRVLDVASFIAAPVAATVLGDYGADVIKVEPPGTGDPNRDTHKLASYPKTAVNYPWEMDSRGKRSIAIDLRSTAGQSVLYRLIERADIFITNYPLEVRGRLKMGYGDVSHINPRLIYASFTGYGETGPDAHLPGFDSTAYFARSGLVDCNRYEGQPPGVVMPAQGDRASGMALLSGILLALLQRGQTGVGTEVSSSLYANALWANGVGAQAALLGGFLPPRPPRDRPRNALTNIYATRDERWLQLTIVREDIGWGPFCQAVGLPRLEHDSRFTTLELRRQNSAALCTILDPIFGSHDWAYWRDTLFRHSIPVGLIGRLQDLPDDAQARACGAIVATNNPQLPWSLAAPFQLASASVPPPERAPELGQQTTEILREAGFAGPEIAALRISKAVN